MMKLSSGLAGVGAALVFGLAAQAAQASSIQCPTGGGGVQQIEVPGEPCEPTGGYTTVTTSGLDATGATYSAELTFEGSNDYLAVGEYIELEIDLDDINAALRANPKAAVELASAIGIRDGKSGVSRVASYAAAKLSDAEYAEMATYISASLQNRATGRSDTATNTSTSRVDAALQAWDRIVSSLGRAVRSAIMPNISRTTRETRRNDQGVVIYERSVETTIN